MPLSKSLRDDLIPEDSFLSLGVVSWEMVEYLRSSVTHQQAGGNGSWRRVAGDFDSNFPPKAKQLLKRSIWRTQRNLL